MKIPTFFSTTEQPRTPGTNLPTAGQAASPFMVIASGLGKMSGAAIKIKEIEDHASRAEDAANADGLFVDFSRELTTGTDAITNLRLPASQTRDEMRKLHEELSRKYLDAVPKTVRSGIVQQKIRNEITRAGTEYLHGAENAWRASIVPETKQKADNNIRDMSVFILESFRRRMKMSDGPSEAEAVVAITRFVDGPLARWTDIMANELKAQPEAIAAGRTELIQQFVSQIFSSSMSETPDRVNPTHPIWGSYHDPHTGLEVPLVPADKALQEQAAVLTRNHGNSERIRREMDQVSKTRAEGHLLNMTTAMLSAVEKQDHDTFVGLLDKYIADIKGDLALTNEHKTALLNDAIKMKIGGVPASEELRNEILRGVVLGKMGFNDVMLRLQGAGLSPVAYGSLMREAAQWTASMANDAWSLGAKRIVHELNPTAGNALIPPSPAEIEAANKAFDEYSRYQIENPRMTPQQIWDVTKGIIKKYKPKTVDAGEGKPIPGVTGANIYEMMYREATSPGWMFSPRDWSATIELIGAGFGEDKGMEKQAFEGFSKGELLKGTAGQGKWDPSKELQRTVDRMIRERREKETRGGSR